MEKILPSTFILSSNFFLSKMTVYLMCGSCIGTTVENTDLIAPCLRWKDKEFTYPDECPKRARGVKIKRKPNWRRIPERIFNIFAKVNHSLGTKYRFFEE